ncbi:recombinase family protein [Rhizobium sp. FY34]|uniref:recombinase family protein n=1 Tax=Rhizobium sp. FY34 TaxID=2562309 RepID=UPI0010C0F4AE|nr:recombinase family protein [Rhizobium sp. FY34]
MKIGYARVSTEDQCLDLQMIALKEAGCIRIFSDHGISGKVLDRPGLKLAIEAVKPGDKLLVWRLDRLGRSLRHLIQLVDELGRRGVEFHSLTENIDTSSSSGRLIFHIMGALAEFERNLISERTRAGMAAARKRGVHLGRRSSIGLSEVLHLRNAYSAGMEMAQLTSRYGVSERTLRRYLQGRLEPFAE